MNTNKVKNVTTQTLDAINPAIKGVCKPAGTGLGMLLKADKVKESINNKNYNVDLILKIASVPLPLVKSFYSKTAIAWDATIKGVKMLNIGKKSVEPSEIAYTLIDALNAMDNNVMVSSFTKGVQDIHNGDKTKDADFVFKAVDVLSIPVSLMNPAFMAPINITTSVAKAYVNSSKFETIDHATILDVLSVTIPAMTLYKQVNGIKSVGSSVKLADFKSLNLDLAKKLLSSTANLSYETKLETLINLAKTDTGNVAFKEAVERVKEIPQTSENIKSTVEALVGSIDAPNLDTIVEYAQGLLGVGEVVSLEMI